MRLLFVTQKVDRYDAVLGFVHRWIEIFAERYKRVTVICLERGEHTLPDAIPIYSLGKETRVSRLHYVLRFWKYMFETRNEYDAVLLHMNQEYVFLGFLFWKCMGKRVALWYNHPQGGWLTTVALMLVDIVFYTSPYAFTAGTAKSRRMPAGIDTAFFQAVTGVVRKPRSILFLGRIAPIKRLEVLIEACYSLKRIGFPFTLSIYGDAHSTDYNYLEQLRQQAFPLVESGHAEFRGPIPHTQTPSIYSTHELFVNLTPTGSYDKTVLEALSCGTLVVASNKAFYEIISEDGWFTEDDPKSLAQAIETILTLRETVKDSYRHLGREHVMEQHGLLRLTEEIERNLTTMHS